MPRQRNESHTRAVDSWMKAQADFNANNMTLLIATALQAVRTRSLATLSGITVLAVIDRVLHECAEVYPVLIPITSDSDGLHFNLFFEKAQNSQHDEGVIALKYLLIELLNALGKITADILTKYLHQELLAVKSVSPALVQNRKQNI